MNTSLPDSSPLQLQAMDLGDILDKSISLYRQNFRVLFGAAAVVHVPLYIFTQVILFAGGLGVFNILLSSLFAILWTFTAMPVCTAAMTKIISERYLGNDMDIRSAYAFVFKKFKLLFGALSLAGIFISLGFLCLIVPGFLCLLWFLFISQVVVLEDTTATAALKRSKILFQSSAGKTVLTIIVVVILTSVVNAIFSVPSGFMGYSDPFAVLEQRTSPAKMLAFALAALGQIVTKPVYYAAMTLLYYDIRIRKEGFDLLMLAQSLGYTVTRKTCGNCGKEVLQESAFCGVCGVKLS